MSMRIVDNINTILGESPIWSSYYHRYFWVDIVGKKLLCVDEQGGEFNEWMFDDNVCSVCPSNDRTLLMALSRQLIRFDPKTGDYQILDNTTPLNSSEMFNDGCIDSKGRLWIATKDKEEQAPIAALYCFDGKSFNQVYQPLTIGNGIDWSVDNTAIYFADSPKQIIYQANFDIYNALLSDIKQFRTLSEGYPDGMTVDSDGNLWGAIWDGGKIEKVSPQGMLLDQIELPALRTTSCCFGGSDNQSLFVTSASIGLEQTTGTHHGSSFILSNIGQGRVSNLFNWS